MVEIACSTGEPWERQEMPSGIYLKECFANGSCRFQHKRAWSRKGSEFPHCSWPKDHEKTENWPFKNDHDWRARARRILHSPLPVSCLKAFGDPPIKAREVKRVRVFSHSRASLDHSKEDGITQRKIVASFR